MIKVITYGTFDYLHQGHINLLQRAKALGDYLIVGVTTDDFDKKRGKINVQQSLMERIEAVRATGLADEIIVEEYEGQKIDDIKRYDIDIFTLGSDWVGAFDYLKEFCQVVYLPRTEGISSSEIRAKKESIRMGLVGDTDFLKKVYKESEYVNGIQIDAYDSNIPLFDKLEKKKSYADLLEDVDAVFIRSQPVKHYEDIKQALMAGKHVLCESPIALNAEQTLELFDLAQAKGRILMESIKTAYATAYSRLQLLIKGGKIGKVVSVDATCTSLRAPEKTNDRDWSGFYEWGPTALLPIFQILGTDYRSVDIVSHFMDNGIDRFTKMDFIYKNAVASMKVGDGVKSEGQLIISGTEGYIYVPAPWWNTDYFEIRYEDITKNKRFFYQLDGEGIRYELVAFLRAIDQASFQANIAMETSLAIARIMDDFNHRRHMTIIE